MYVKVRVLSFCACSLSAAFVSVCMVASLVFIPVSSASAAITDKATLESRRQVIFEQILRDPANLDLSFEYASLSSQVGDYEGAITAMERMLIFAPGLPRIQLELGVLYYRLGSFAIAQNYLEQAVSGSNVPDVVRSRVAAYLDRIRNAQKRDKFSGSVLAGIRYQSNANSGPSSANVNLNGIGFTLNDNSVRKDDVNAFVAVTFHYDHDLQRQGDLFEADVLFYGAKYLDVTNLDTVVTELTLGPSFNLQRYNIDNTQLGLYGIGNFVGLDDKLYFTTLGFGARISHHTEGGSRVRAKTEFREKWYNNTSQRPTAKNRDGTRLSAEVAASSPITTKVLAHGIFRVERENVDADFFSYYQVGGEFGVTTTLTSPFTGEGTFKNVMFFDVTGGYRHTGYDEADPAINANNKQKSNELFARATLTIPVADNFTIVPQVEYRDNSSNYDLYDFNGWTAYIALGKKF